MSIALVTPVFGSIENSRPVFVWTVISLPPLATMPLALKPAAMAMSPLRAMVVAWSGAGSFAHGLSGTNASCALSESVA